MDRSAEPVPIALLGQGLRQRRVCEGALVLLGVLQHGYVIDVQFEGHGAEDALSARVDDPEVAPQLLDRVDCRACTLFCPSNSFSFPFNSPRTIQG